MDGYSAKDTCFQNVGHLGGRMSALTHKLDEQDQKAFDKDPSYFKITLENCHQKELEQYKIIS